MSHSVIDTVPLFELRSEIHVSASADKVYSVVSDLSRSGEWSPECLGGEWTSGEPSTVGAVFRGKNLRPEDVVGWAPLIRGIWYTEAQVLAAEPGRTFQWAMRTHVGENQDSVWGFDMVPTESGCVLVHHFRMGRATEGIHKIVKDLNEEDRQRFITDWTAKLVDDLAITLDRIKAVVEKD
jgi:hypothetical protein